MGRDTRDMANFQTHLNVGIFVSAAATLSLHVAGFIEQSQMPVLFALGVAGSLLPDIDLERSKPTGLLFNVLGAVLAFAVTLPLTQRFSRWCWRRSGARSFWQCAMVC
jgi:hypothetical protein